jgi:cytochrome c oxidase assembly protein subunit 15
LGIAIALLISTKLAESAATWEIWGRKVKIFIGVAIAQGGIGYVQYFTGLPEAIVGAHILGAVLVWISAWNLVISGNVLTRKERL